MTELRIPHAELRAAVILAPAAPQFRHSSSIWRQDGQTFEWSLSHRSALVPSSRRAIWPHHSREVRLRAVGTRLPNGSPAGLDSEITPPCPLAVPAAQR